MNTTRVWIEGLVAALIGGAANAVTVIVVDPLNFNLGDGLGKLLQVVAVGAIWSRRPHFLKQSPIPKAEQEGTE
jgi:hypothetical protein